MALSDLVISASGIRGIVHEGLSPEIVRGLASAFATVVGGEVCVVGRDTRPSGKILNPAVLSGITAVGSNVIDVGVCPTPTIQLAVEHHGASGGIALTASHNPAEWNALKLISASGTFLAKREVDSVVEAFTSGEVEYAPSREAGCIEQDAEATMRHLSKVLDLEYVDSAKIRRRGFKVAIDATNGAGSAIAPDLLRALGCDVVRIDCDLSGVFRRDPEPLRENIQDLCATVRAEQADVGFALDPDGDRLALVDERGDPLGEDYTLVICADVVLKKSRGAVVTNLSTSKAVEDVARTYGVEFVRAPIGEINVVEKMKAVGSTIGGEGNGGVILPAVHYGRDALVAMALVLQAMIEAGTTLSEMMKSFSKYDIFKKKVRLTGEVDFESVRALLEKEFAGARFGFEDGIRVEFDDRWLHVRKSGTEPVIRLISEARDRATSRRLVSKALDVLRKQGGL